MKKTGAAAIVFALATFSVAAQEQPQPAGDFSRPALQRTFSMRRIELPERPKRRVQFHFGAVEFRALGMDWRILYLPIAVPLAGTRVRANNEYPDPFELTRPNTPPVRLFDPMRKDVRVELRRIEKRDRPKRN
jgi:hypothetical protein